MAEGEASFAPASASSAPSATPAAPDAQVPGAATAARELAAPMASPQWRQDLGQRVVGLVRQGDGKVSLQLNPAELGPLLVELKLSEQHAHLHFASPHAQVRHAVEQAIPQLREALAEQGISLGEAQVGEHGGQEGREPLPQRRFAGVDAANANSGAATPARHAALIPMGDGGQVNVYV